MTDLSSTPQSLHGWYQHSKGDPRQFFKDLQTLDCPTLATLIRRDCALAPRGRLRTAVELELLNRTPKPSLDNLRKRTGSEQTLQWMFIHREYFYQKAGQILWRELPTCCAGEPADGRCDLLVFDKEKVRPVLVELKQGSAGDPLTGVLLEALWHWAFTIRHLDSFDAQIRGFGFAATDPPGIAVAAPDQYFRRTSVRTRSPRNDEFKSALAWISYLKQNKIVDIDLYSVSDDWQRVGPSFAMQRIYDNMDI